MTRTTWCSYTQHALEPNEEELTPVACPNCGSTTYERIVKATNGKNYGDFLCCSDCCKEIYYDDEELFNED